MARTGAICVTQAWARRTRRDCSWVLSRRGAHARGRGVATTTRTTCRARPDGYCPWVATTTPSCLGYRISPRWRARRGASRPWQECAVTAAPDPIRGSGEGHRRVGARLRALTSWCAAAERREAHDGALLAHPRASEFVDERPRPSAADCRKPIRNNDGIEDYVLTWAGGAGGRQVDRQIIARKHACRSDSSFGR